MYQEERLLQILDYLKINNRITVNQMIDYYGISRDTARRDLVKLVEQDKVIRTRGGAILPPKIKNEDKENTQQGTYEFNFDSKEKQSIAENVLDLIQEGDNLLMDASVSAQYLADILDVPSTLVITNSLQQVQILRHNINVDVQLLGGKLDKESNFFYGASLMETLDRYYVDKVIIGADGINSEGITFSDEEDGRIRSSMIKHGKQVIVLADNSAFGKRELYLGISLKNVDKIVTSKKPDDHLRNLLDMYNVELIVTS